MTKMQKTSILFKRRWLVTITAAVLLVAVSFMYFTTSSTDQNQRSSGYAVHEGITATIFWIGEPADDSNDYISNVPTAWDSDATKRFGGADGPSKRDGNPSDVPRDDNGIITSFKPLENPYYVALPAVEFMDDGSLVPDAREKSPWANQTVGIGQSLFKGRWLRINLGDKTVYAQWLDVGPNVDDDYAYVFGDGSTRPKNNFGYKAGIDISPATAFSLGFKDDSRQVSWQFVDDQDVEDGPWKEFPAINTMTYWTDDKE